MPKAQRRTGKQPPEATGSQRGAFTRQTSQARARLTFLNRTHRNGRGRLPLRLLALIPLVLVLALVAYQGAVRVYHSALFAVRWVEVVNARYVGPETIAATSGLGGANFFTFEKQPVRARLLALPMVYDVQVQRRFPRQVRITVWEREPWAYWDVLGKRHVIAEDGVVLDRGLPVEGAPVVIQVDTGRELQPGDRVDADALHLTQTLQQRLPEDLRLHPTAFQFRSRDGLTVVMRDGMRITFGDSRDMEYKLSVLRALLARVPETVFVDLRFGDRVVYQTRERPLKPSTP